MRQVLSAPSQTLDCAEAGGGKTYVDIVGEVTNVAVVNEGLLGRQVAAAQPNWEALLSKS
jgi:hypothetical protein